MRRAPVDASSVFIYVTKAKKYRALNLCVCYQLNLPTDMKNYEHYIAKQTTSEAKEDSFYYFALMLAYIFLMCEKSVEDF